MKGDSYIADRGDGSPCFCVGPLPGHAMCPCVERAAGMSPHLDTLDWTPDMSKESISRMTAEYEQDEKDSVARKLHAAATNSYIDGLNKRRKTINHPASEAQAVTPADLRALPPGTIIYTRGDFRTLLPNEEHNMEREERRMLDQHVPDAEVDALREALAKEHRQVILLKEELRAVNKIIDTIRDMVIWS